MELEQSVDRFKSQGLNVAAISVDTQEILAHFAERMGGFSYPLLADPDAKMIRAFGVLNRNVPEEHAYFGMARPGTFIVDANGMVTSKYFEPGHRQRTTASSLLVKEFGVAGGTRMEVETEQFKLTAYPAQDVVRRGNRITLVMDVELLPKMHLYAPGVEGYTPVSVNIHEAPYLIAHETVFPESEIMHLPAINERVPVFHGSVRILQDVTLSPRHPGYDKPDEVELEIPATFGFQACDDKVCYLPDELPLKFKMTVIPHDGDRVPDELRKKPRTSNF